MSLHLLQHNPTLTLVCLHNPLSIILTLQFFLIIGISCIFIIPLLTFIVISFSYIAFFFSFDVPVVAIGPEALSNF
jgi:hypothetical protein